MKKLCFLSGLLRSGSALLAALSRQNPRVHAHQRVAFELVAYDEMAGLPGVHEVRLVVDPTMRKTVLPTDLYNCTARHEGVVIV